MDNLRFKGRYQGGQHKINVSLFVISFKENDVCFVYSPALDITGYGNTADEAKDSFNITLQEFLRYTSNKNTLVNELKRLGWKVHKYFTNQNRLQIEKK